MPHSSYESHATRLQKKAEEAHALWLSTLTPEQYQQAIDYGVIDPPKDSHKVGGHPPCQTKDLAESPRASFENDIAEDIDTLPEEIADTFGIPLAIAAEIAQWHEEVVTHAANQYQSHLIQSIVGGILSSRNPKLAAAGIAFATKLDALNGMNQSDYAAANNISRQAVSKCTKHWQRVLGVAPSAHQKSESACAAYKEAATNDHWRQKIFKITNLIKKATS